MDVYTVDTKFQHRLSLCCWQVKMDLIYLPLGCAKPHWSWQQALITSHQKTSYGGHLCFHAAAPFLPLLTPHQAKPPEAWWLVPAQCHGRPMPCLLWHLTAGRNNKIDAIFNRFITLCNTKTLAFGMIIRCMFKMYISLSDYSAPGLHCVTAWWRLPRSLLKTNGNIMQAVRGLFPFRSAALSLMIGLWGSGYHFVLANVSIV